MAIETTSAIIKGLGNQYVPFKIDKANIGNQTAGRTCSLFRATGQPAQGAIPTTPAICNKALLGALQFNNVVLPIKNYIAKVSSNNSNASSNLEIRDRLAHMGGLNLTLLTSQTTTGLDLLSLAVPADRIGVATDYSDVEWFLEVYIDGGATASLATINVTYGDGTIANLNAISVATLRAGNMLALTPLIPTAQQGKFIRGINSIILTASTGTAGNFGFTAYNLLTEVDTFVANKTETKDWAGLGLPFVPNDACLILTTFCSTNSSGNIRGSGKIING